MDLKTYIHSNRGAGTALAESLSKATGRNISLSYLSQMAAGDAPISPELCVLIEKNTGGEVRRQKLKDNWQSIWPELSA